MKKARFLSFVHILGLAALVGMFYVYGASTILACVLTGVDGLQSYGVIAKGIQLILNSEYWRLLISDILSNKPFSILFTAVFSSASIWMLNQPFRSFLRSSWASVYCTILYFILFSSHFLLNQILPTSKFIIFLLALLIILVFSHRYNTENTSLWTSMEEPPKYYTCNALSLFILGVSTSVQAFLILFVMKLITNFLTYLFNIFVFPQIVGFLITRIVILVAIIAMIMSWRILGEMHDRIIAQLSSCK